MNATSKKIKDRSFYNYPHALFSLHSCQTYRLTHMKFRPFKETKYIWAFLFLLSGLAIIFKSSYRTYIYAHQINDFGIADASPNFFAGLIITLLFFIQFQSMTFQKHAIYAAIGLIAYEVIQGNIFQSNYFDAKDIVATVLGVAVGYAIGLQWKTQLDLVRQKPVSKK